jgi:hypothetical protein
MNWLFPDLDAACIYLLVILGISFILLIFVFLYNESYKVWKDDYYRDKDLLMRKEKLIYRIYRMFL